MNLREIIRAAKDQGWEVTKTSRLHVKFIPPGDRPPVYAPGTPSDVRSMANTIAQLRRSGLVLGARRCDGPC